MQKTCPQCYLTPLAKEWETCPRCGQELAAPTTTSTWRKRAAIGAALVVLVAGGAFGGAALMGSSGDGPAVAEPAPVATAEPSPTPEVRLSQASMSNSDIAKKYGDSVYRLEAEGCGFVSSGTGWVIDENHLVTNWHVVSTDLTPTVIGRDGTSLEGEVIGGTTRPDVAVVRVDGELAAPLVWAATDQLTEGQEIVGLGYPAPALDFSVTPGSIVSFQVDDGQREAIRTDGALDKGNSGGPALTRTGQVAGVVTEMAANDGLQLVPLLYTATTLEAVVDDMIEDPEPVEPDCDPDFDVLPDGDWADDLPERASDYGDDPALDALYDRCSSGDMGACDDLYWRSGFGTEYEAMATSCGGAASSPVYGLCDYYATQAAADAEAASQVAALVDKCEAGTMSACDELEIVADWGTTAADVADRCGGHYPDGYGSCVDREAEANEISALVSTCQGGDMQACDDLQIAAAWGSDAAEIGESCGGHYPNVWGSCVSAEEDAMELQGYYDACKAGDLGACDDLYLYADYGSDWARFGSTCGNRYPQTYGMCEFDHGP